MDHGNVDPGLTAGGVVFVVLAQAAVAAEPAERPLHDPALGQVDVALGPHRRRMGVSTQPNDSRTQSTTAAYAPSAQTTARRGSRPRHPLQQHPGPVPVLDVGRQHGQPPDQAERLSQDVALAAADFFSASYPLGPPASAVLRSDCR